MVILADKNDMNIHCVYRERKLEGWIVLKTEAEIKQVKEFQDDIDVVKALESTDYLKIRQAVAARMPDANINEIRDVALSEYKQYNMINRSDSFTVTPRRPHKAPVSTSQPPRNCNTAPNYGLRSAIANEILETLIREGVYHVKSFLKSKNYLSSIICDIRSMGYELECIKENREAISYKLIQK